MNNPEPDISSNNGELKVMQWNVNGVTDKREYFKLLLDIYTPDILFLSETNRRSVIEEHKELACGDEYRVVQIKSTATNRGGLIAVIKTCLNLVTAEIVRINEGDDFAQAIVLTDKDEREFIGWYNTPVMTRRAFGEKLEKLLAEYDVQFVTGDFNARHRRWCTQHDGNKRGTQLLNLIRTRPEYQIHATQGPTFEAIADKAKGTKRCNTIDLLLSKATVKSLKREMGYISVCSDHCPVVDVLDTQIELSTRPRRVAKTLLQSEQHRKAIGLLYEVALQRTGELLENIRTDTEETPQTAHILEAYYEAVQIICEPWTQMAKKKRRRCAAYVSRELLRLWQRKKVLYDRMKWRPTPHNKKEYKEAYAKAQRRERQLKREHERRTCQRIQNNPNSDIEIALRTSLQKHNRQKALDRATGKQLKPKQFADYMSTNIALGELEELMAREFVADKKKHAANVVAEIRAMDNNKAVGTDGAHVEIFKCNAGKIEDLLTELWCTIGHTRIVPTDWLRGIIVPLYKGKGDQAHPKSYRPLIILSHARKVTEKAVILELEKVVETDRAKFGF